MCDLITIVCGGSLEVVVALLVGVGPAGSEVGPSPSSLVLPSDTLVTAVLL